MKYKFIILCLIISIFSGCGTIQKEPAEESIVSITPMPTITVTPTVTIAPTITLTPVIPTVIPSPMPTIIPDVASEEKEHSKAYLFYSDIAGQEVKLESGIVTSVQINDEETVYPMHTVALMKNTEIACTIEGVRTVDPLSNKRFVIIDFSLMNLSPNDYVSDEYDLSLCDTSGYTYTPSIYTLDNMSAPVGDLSMIIKSDDMARGEVAFEVPYRSSDVLTLRYDTPEFESERVSFEIDLSSSYNQNGIQSSSIK